MNPIMNSAAIATYGKLPKKAQYITILITGVAMAVYAGYKLAKKARNDAAAGNV